MTVMARETWTDERLGDLDKKIDQGFERVAADGREVKAEVRNLRSEMNGRFERVDDEFKGLRTEMSGHFERVDGDIRELRAETSRAFERVDDEFRELRTEMNGRFDAMQRTMILGFASIVASVIATQL
jgi:uncharacterized protein YPO0396